jgi:hypothetical protein
MTQHIENLTELFWDTGLDIQAKLRVASNTRFELADVHPHLKACEVIATKNNSRKRVGLVPFQ